jgi:hypothetical protein
MRLVEDKGNVSTVVSTRDVTGEVTGAGEVATPVMLAATLTVKEQKQKNGGYITTVTWKLNGPTDPNATYQLLVSVTIKGQASGLQAPQNMPQPIAGNQFQAQGSLPIAMPVPPQTQYEVVLTEYTQANKMGKRLGSHTGVLK